MTIWLKEGLPQMKRLVVPPLSFDVYVTSGDVVPALIVEMLTPRRTLVFPMERVNAVHAVIGIWRPDPSPGPRGTSNAVPAL